MLPAESRRNPLVASSKLMNEAGIQAEAPEPLSEVVEACQRGDAEAQRRLYEAFHQQVYRLVVRMVGAQDASDVTQQVFLQVFRKIGQYSGRSQFGTWIYRVAINEALQHLRRSKRTQLRILEREPEDRSPDPNESVGHNELLQMALERLDPELRSAFLLREVEGLSYSAIAEVLQVPEGTVGSRLNRARRELQVSLTELGWEP